jgi:hypothetical protein
MKESDLEGPLKVFFEKNGWPSLAHADYHMAVFNTYSERLCVIVCYRLLHMPLHTCMHTKVPTVCTYTHIHVHTIKSTASPHVIRTHMSWFCGHRYCGAKRVQHAHEIRLKRTHAEAERTMYAQVYVPT